MTSKIHKKLKRLHDSRVRALEAEPRVIEAEALPDVPETVQPVEIPPDRFQNLKRAKDLEDKTKVSRGAIPRSPSAAAETGVTQAAAHSGAGVGERVKHLRLAATDASSTHDALPFLFEMVALQPDNTFALSRLVQHFRATQQLEFAKLFSARLKEHSPF